MKRPWSDGSGDAAPFFVEGLGGDLGGEQGERGARGEEMSVHTARYTKSCHDVNYVLYVYLYQYVQ